MRRRTLWPVVLLALLAGCGGAGGQAEEPAAGVASTAAEEQVEPVDDEPSPGAEFCAAISAAGSDLAVLDDAAMATALVTDPAGTFSRAAAIAEAIEPPADLAADWQALRELSRAYADGLADVDPQDGAALQQVLGELSAAQDASTFEAVGRLGVAIEDRCGPGAGAAGSVDLCPLVDEGTLAAVFAAAVPEPVSTDYTEGFVECVWQDQERMVRVSVLPIEAMHADYLDALPATDAVPAVTDGVAFDDVVGIGHVSSGGRTVAFSSEQGGVMVAVRSGGADDDALATALAQTVAGGL